MRSCTRPAPAPGRRRFRAGVSLLELLAVLAIIAVLATLALGRGRAARDRAEITRLMTEARELHRAQEVYRAETGGYYPGPFTPAAITAAGFGYTPPPGRSVLVLEAGQNTWRGRLSPAEDSEGSRGVPGSYCAIALNSGPPAADEGVACTLPTGRPTDRPDDEGRAND